MSDLTLRVTGMTCGGCENAVRRALSTVDGVRDVTASHREDLVTVRYDASKIAPEAIAARIEQLGYDVTR